MPSHDPLISFAGAGPNLDQGELAQRQNSDETLKTSSTALKKFDESASELLFMHNQKNWAAIRLQKRGGRKIISTGKFNGTLKELNNSPQCNMFETGG